MWHRLIQATHLAHGDRSRFESGGQDVTTNIPAGNRSTGIPTDYNGLTYRSKTEAKWAVFMDRLEIMHDYEIQGWDTDGEWYLPDFVIFGALGTIWAEIKPTYKADPKGVAKWRRFAAKRPMPSRAALITGLPWKYGLIVVGGDLDAEKPVQGPWEDDTQEWRPCGSGYHYDFCSPGPFGTKFAEDGCPDRFGGGGEQKIEDAAAFAKAYRFDRRGNAAA